MAELKHLEVPKALHTRARHYSKTSGLKLGVMSERAMRYALEHPQAVFFGSELPIEANPQAAPPSAVESK